MIILASASPRREELLHLITDDFKVVVSGVDEDVQIEDAKKLVRFLAEKKAADVARSNPHDVVIGADTVVEAGGEIFDKPAGLADARRMIGAMSGQTHFVHTGICVIKGDVRVSKVCSTAVTFNTVGKEEIEYYLRTEDIMDKAGAYAIQGGAAKFISRIEGCFFNVVGLPVSTLYQLLQQFDLK